MVDEHLKLLGHKATDKVTGFKGVITTIAFDLYGCIQAVVTPPTNETGKKENAGWFDVPRLEITSQEPVMPIPDFEKGYPIPQGKKGPAEKPDRR